MLTNPAVRCCVQSHVTDEETKVQAHHLTGHHCDSQVQHGEDQPGSLQTTSHALLPSPVLTHSRLSARLCLYHGLPSLSRAWVWLCQALAVGKSDEGRALCAPCKNHRDALCIFWHPCGVPTSTSPPGTLCQVQRQQCLPCAPTYPGASGGRLGRADASGQAGWEWRQ